MILPDETRAALERALAMPTRNISERGLRSAAIMTACLDIGFWLHSFGEVAKWVLTADTTARAAVREAVEAERKH